MVEGNYEELVQDEERLDPEEFSRACASPGLVKEVLGLEAPSFNQNERRPFGRLIVKTSEGRKYNLPFGGGYSV